jgi:acyl carrier protein
MTDERIREIERRVIALVAWQAGTSEVEITRAAHFRDDLNFDSLDFIELTMAIETEFDIAVPDTDAEHLQTVGAVVDFAAERLKVSAAEG